ncbi:MAG: vitamin K epoxide reductase family protein [Bacillota bacterium]
MRTLKLQSLFLTALCFLGFYLSVNRLFLCEVCKRIEILGIPLEIWGAVIYLGVAVLHFMGLSKFLKYLLSIWISAHLGLILYYQINIHYLCPVCLVLLFIEIALLIMAIFFSDQKRDISKAAGACIIFIFLTLFFSFKAGLFSINFPAMAGGQLENKNISISRKAELVGRNNDTKRQVDNSETGQDKTVGENVLTVLNDRGEKVTIKEPVLFFAWW